MWCIDEASIEKEGSLVLFGSNDATPVIYQKSEVEKALKCDSCDEETEDFEAENGEIVCKKCGNKKKAEKSLSQIEAEKSLQNQEKLKELLNKFKK